MKVFSYNNLLFYNFAFVADFSEGCPWTKIGISPNIRTSEDLFERKYEYILINVKITFGLIRLIQIVIVKYLQAKFNICC